MCGIIGEVAETPIDVDVFESMRDELAHRGPDGSGTYTNEDGTVALGFRRLAIIDLSDAGMQPMTNEDGTLHLVYNGEIYNYRVLREELVEAGHTFSSETDSEVILHGYEEWGEEVLDRLQGMFAFGIWDEVAEELILARDPFGIKPIHYYQGSDRFVFASELKAIVADEDIPRDISPTAMTNYFRYRYVPAPLTIWQDTYKLPPGHYLIFDGDETSVEQYWDAREYRGTNDPPFGQATDELFERLADSISQHLVSDVPVGVLLSGGTDSSIIAAFAADSLSELSSFSMGFEGVDDELEYARLVADACDLDQREEILRPEDFDGLLDDILYYYDEPLADSSIFPTFLLMNHAGEDMKVVLAGDGGDELFAGYRWYDTYLCFKRFNPLASLVRPLYQWIRGANRRLRSDPLQSAEWRTELASLQGLEQYQTAMHPPIRRHWREKIVSDDFDDEGDSDPVDAYASEQMNVKDLQYLDLQTFLPDDILAKVDRASMANSLEVRVPMLNRAIAEYALSLDEDLLYHDGEKKRLLNRVARDLVPERVVDRPKSGFGGHLDRSNFLEEHIDVLSDSRAAEDGILDQDGLDEYIRSEPQNHNLFKLILFEYWYRRWCC